MRFAVVVLRLVSIGLPQWDAHWCVAPIASAVPDLLALHVCCGSQAELGENLTEEEMQEMIDEADRNRTGVRYLRFGVT